MYTCGYEFTTNLQNIVQKDLNKVKIFLKVLGANFLKHVPLDLLVNLNYFVVIYEYKHYLYIGPWSTILYRISISRRSRVATAAADLRNDAVHLFVCLFVCRPHAYTKRFSRKLRNLELWSLLTNNRKSYMGFSKNTFMDP